MAPKSGSKQTLFGFCYGCTASQISTIYETTDVNLCVLCVHTGKKFQNFWMQGVAGPKKLR